MKKAENIANVLYIMSLVVMALVLAMGVTMFSVDFINKKSSPEPEIITAEQAKELSNQAIIEHEKDQFNRIMYMIEWKSEDGKKFIINNLTDANKGKLAEMGYVITEATDEERDQQNTPGKYKISWE